MLCAMAVGVPLMRERRDNCFGDVLGFGGRFALAEVFVQVFWR